MLSLYTRITVGIEVRRACEPRVVSRLRDVCENHGSDTNKLWLWGVLILYDVVGPAALRDLQSGCRKRQCSMTVRLGALLNVQV